MNDWADQAIATLLRIGVLLSVSVITLGVILTFAHHREYFSSRPPLGALTSPDTHFPNTIREVISGVAHGDGEAMIMLGLLLLIATPVSRVALSIAIFVKVRDRLYTAITATVLLILLISFAVGLVGA